MKRFLGGVAFAVAASTAVLGFGAAPASADDDVCVWSDEEGGEYPVGSVKEEFWGTETRPDGRVEHRYRLFRCEPGDWWNYIGDRYYPDRSGGGDDDDDGWGGGGGGGGGGDDGWGCWTDPWDWSPDPLCAFQF
jgi:hypothetical protein